MKGARRSGSTPTPRDRVPSGMTPTEFGDWQAGLPVGCDELTALLTTLQEEWVHAQAA